jgi:hypothetical protein
VNVQLRKIIDSLSEKIKQEEIPEWQQGELLAHVMWLRALHEKLANARSVGEVKALVGEPVLPQT